ncbi:hypothetical protein [Mycobacterium phage Maco6]|uniref:Tail terminator n=1 Tax=Mycobacterium phage Maco2 TaxID=2805749 RepID=A0A899IN93_9CAUD|nr:hypothetical protein [Mycobacterium phage Maco2]UNY41938.1 hypothetical protein [Mycobacterium phage Maco6]WKV22173.1 tail terminator [Mycobacteroides phage 8UZL]
MKTLLFPRPKLLARTFLKEQLPAFGADMPVEHRNPDPLPERWVRLDTESGPQTLGTLDVFVTAYIYNTRNSSQAEEDSGLVRSLMHDAPGVAIPYPGGPADFPWVVRSRHISGPSDLGDEDLPGASMYRVITQWTLHYLKEIST